MNDYFFFVQLDYCNVNFDSGYFSAGLFYQIIWIRIILVQLFFLQDYFTQDYFSTKLFYLQDYLIQCRVILPGYCKLKPPLKTARLFFGKSRDLENSTVRLFFGEISPNLSERLFTIFFQYFSQDLPCKNAVFPKISRCAGRSTVRLFF